MRSIIILYVEEYDEEFIIFSPSWRISKRKSLIRDSALKTKRSNFYFEYYYFDTITSQLDILLTP